MKIKFFVLGLLCLYFSAGAQKHNEVKPLTVGDPIPEMEFTNVLNYHEKSLKLSDFKDKLLILDFWNTWCATCMEAIPRIEGLAQNYNGQVSIIGVNDGKGDDLKKVQNFVRIRQKQYDFKTIYADKLLDAMFPHKGVPHCVWIFNDRIAGITAIDEINQTNIDQVLRSGKLDAPTKIADAFDKKKPIFLDGNGGIAPSYLARFILTPSKPNIVSYKTWFANDDTSVRGFTCAGCDILTLYKFANPSFGNFTPNRTIVREVNSIEFALSDSSNYFKRNRFIYESSFSPRNKKDALGIMQEHLHQVFDMSIDSQLVEKPCLVISRLPGKFRSIASKDTVLRTNWWDYDGQPISIVGIPFTTLIEQLNQVSKIPVIDETGIAGLVDITLPRNLQDQALLSTYLGKAGLQIQLLSRKLYFLVLSEPAYTNNNLSAPITIKR